MFHLVLFSKDAVFNSIMLFLHELITKKQPNNRDSVIKLIKILGIKLQRLLHQNVILKTYAPRIHKLTELEKCICSASVVSPQPPSSEINGQTPSPLLPPSGAREDSSSDVVGKKRKGEKHAQRPSPKRLKGIDLLLEAFSALNSSTDAQSNESVLSNQGSSSSNSLGIGVAQSNNGGSHRSFKGQSKEANGFLLGDNSARATSPGQDIGGASQRQDAGASLSAQGSRAASQGQGSGFVGQLHKEESSTSSGLEVSMEEFLNEEDIRQKMFYKDITVVILVLTTDRFYEGVSNPFGWRSFTNSSCQ